MSPKEDWCQFGIEFGVVLNPRILLLLLFVRRVRVRVSEVRCWAQQQGGERWGTPRTSSACRKLRRWEGASRNGKLPRMHSKSRMVSPERYVIRWHVCYVLLCFLFFLFVWTSQGGLCNESLLWACVQVYALTGGLPPIMPTLDPVNLKKRTVPTKKVTPIFRVIYWINTWW